MISVTDGFYSWLTAEAESIGIPSATMATMLLSEAKKARDDQANAKMASDRMREQFAKLFEAGIESGLRKTPESPEDEGDLTKKAREAEAGMQMMSDKMKEQFAKLFEEGVKSGFKKTPENADSKDF